MIEGLKVFVSGVEVADLARERARLHEERAALYEKSIEDLASSAEDLKGTSSNPNEQLRARADEHRSSAAEMLFIAEHISPTETYLLDREALFRLGIVKNRY